MMYFLTRKAKGALHIELEREEDGRWIAEIPEIPGVMVYGETEEEAIRLAKALALEVLADRLRHHEEILSAIEDLFAISK